MSKKANPTSIGIFVFAGLALGVAGLLLFSSARLFKANTKFVIYFDTDLNGLREGAPVKYRGVTVGSVYHVMIHYNQLPGDSAMPVIIELREDLIRRRVVGATLFHGLKDLGDEVRKDLRATLETESLVTGVLYINLEILSAPPPAVYHQQAKMYVEIPSRPTRIQLFVNSLADTDLAGLANKLNALVTRVDGVVGDIHVAEIRESFTNLLVSLNRVVNSPDLTNAFANLNSTLVEYRLLAQKLNNRVDPLADGLTNTLAQASVALSQIRSGVQNVGDLLGPNSDLRHDLSLTLDQLAGAAQSIADLAEYLRNHPNALINGTRLPEKKP
jgi:paraquat-inducible protein B